MKLLSEYNKHRSKGNEKCFCLAPFNSMMFDIGGKVKPCWNSPGLFEHYPEKSISEIWHGNTYNELRKSFRDNKLPTSCSFCKVLLSLKNFDSVMALKYDQFPLNKNGYPSYMEFIADNSCNLECVMCNGVSSSSIRKNRNGLDPIPKKYDKNFVNQLREFIPHLKATNFIGGEPFLINIYYDVWEIIAELNPNIISFITTNGTVLNDRVKKVLENGRFSIILSLDSLNKMVFETIRQNANFDTVLNNLYWFREYTKRKGTNFTINMCILKDTWTEVPAMIDFCNKLECTIYFCDVFQPAKHVIWSLNSTEIKKIYDHLTKFSFPDRTQNEKTNQNQYKQFLQELNNWFLIALKRESSIDTLQNIDKDLVYKMLYERYSVNPKLVNESEKELLSKKIIEMVNFFPQDFFTKIYIDKLFEIPDELVILILLFEHVETFYNYSGYIKYFAESEKFLLS
ncbi:MAG: radical SAM protein [Bacteroidales bacterium]|nr:radical SAM protein [Bacteroidales bacterium]